MKIQTPYLGMSFALVILLSVVACAHVSTGPNPWPLVKEPSQAPPQSIGEYSAGCLNGAKILPPTGRHYQIMRLSRHRNFGHPLLLDFIQNVADSIHERGWGDLLVGDMGLPRGGPTLSGHASHQTGLDVDLWYQQAPVGKILSPKERETLSSPHLVFDDFEGFTKAWHPRYLQLLKIAATEASVQRIFVNPVIKKEMCRKFKDEKDHDGWMSKLRPWWFHQDHFHVRLHCAPNDSTCVVQEAVPQGDGCDGDLETWFTAETKAKEKDMREHPTPTVMPKLPSLCAGVLKEKPQEL